MTNFNQLFYRIIYYLVTVEILSPIILMINALVMLLDNYYRCMSLSSREWFYVIAMSTSSLMFISLRLLKKEQLYHVPYLMVIYYNSYSIMTALTNNPSSTYEISHHITILLIFIFFSIKSEVRMVRLFERLNPRG